MTEAEIQIKSTKLESYLSKHLDEPVTDTEVLNDGLNLNLALATENHDRVYVLRKPNKLRHTDLFNEPKQEYELLLRLEDTSIPTPTPIHYCEDESILGEEFFVTTYLDGEPIPLGSNLPERFQNPRSRTRIANLLIDTLAEIHTLEVEPFEDVCERQTPLDQVEFAIDRLDRAREVTGRELPMLREVGVWLRENAPSNPRTTLVHGDFRPGNVLFAGTDQPEITGVLDWETSMRGDPLTELGYLLLRWRDDGDPTPSLDEIEAKYPDEVYADAIERLREANEHGLAPFTNEPGSPSRRELVARYEEQTGVTVENDRFYRAHAAFMLAAVWVDLHRFRVEAGEESDWEPRIEYVSMMAERIVRGDFEL